MDKHEKRFWGKVNKTESCWLWRGYIRPNGYTTFSVGFTKVYAHRYSYELAKGKIPDGLQIDHTCFVRHCVNPSHLEAVTHRENLLRSPTLVATESAKTHCSNGHEFSEENTYRNPKQLNKRHCRTCAKEAYRQRAGDNPGYGLGPGGLKRAQTHCKRGHEFTDENTRKYLNRLGNISRWCKACEKIRVRA